MKLKISPALPARLRARPPSGEADDNPRVSGWLAGPSSVSDSSDDDILAVVGSSLADPDADVGSPDDLRITASLLPGGIEVVGAYVHAQPGTDPHGEAEALLHSVRQGCTGLRNTPSSKPFVIAVVHDGTDIAFFAHPRGLFGAGDLPRGAVTAEVLPEDWLETRYALLRCGGWAVDATEAAFDAAAKEATSRAGPSPSLNVPWPPYVFPQDATSGLQLWAWDLYPLKRACRALQCPPSVVFLPSGQRDVLF